MGAPALKYFSEADYLAMERESEEKHFYYAGEIYAMAGASYEHNVIESNLRFCLHSHLQGKACSEFGSNLRLHAPGQSFYTYPDIMVFCGKPGFLEGSFDTVINPTMLVEILSEGTADYDKGLKFDLYRRIESLAEYLLLDSRRVHLLQYTRNNNGSWNLKEFEALSDSVHLSSIGMHLPLKECYAGLDLA